MSDDSLYRIACSCGAAITALIVPLLLFSGAGFTDAWMWVVPAEAVLATIGAAALLAQSRPAGGGHDDGWGGGGRGWDPDDDPRPLPTPTPVELEVQEDYQLAS